MKSEDSKLLLGLAIGAAIGTAIGYFWASDKKKLKDDFHHAVDEVKEGMKNVVDKVKEHADTAGAAMAGKTEDVAEKVAYKAGQVKDKFENAASGK